MAWGADGTDDGGDRAGSGGPHRDLSGGASEATAEAWAAASDAEAPDAEAPDAEAPEAEAPEADAEAADAAEAALAGAIQCARGTMRFSNSNHACSHSSAPIFAGMDSERMVAVAASMLPVCVGVCARIRYGGNIT